VSAVLRIRYFSRDSRIASKVDRRYGDDASIGQDPVESRSFLEPLSCFGSPVTEGEILRIVEGRLAASVINV